MDKKRIKNFQIFSTIFTFILGTLLHFTYNLSDNNKLVAVFSSVNESTWEHLKLIYFPMVITLIIGLVYFKNSIPNFLCSKTIGILTSIFFTIIFFYTYSGVIGKNIAVIDILSFFISVTLGEYVTYKMITTYFKCNDKISIIILIVLLICFVIFTFYTPKIGLFKDPVSRNYGIIENRSQYY